MTVPSQTTISGPFTLNGVTTTFAYGFKILDEAELEFVKYATADGAETILSITSVTGVGEASGGNVIISPAPSGGTGYVRRKSTMTQPTTLTNVGPFQPSVVMRMVDRAVMYALELREQVHRSIRLSVGEDCDPLPPAEFRRNTLVGFDDDGELMLSGGVSGSVSLSAAMTPVVQATVPAAVALLDQGNPFTDVASAATVDLGAVGSDKVRITGSSGPITSFGTVAAGTRKLVRLASTPTMTYDATSLILPGDTDIVGQADDGFEAVSLGSGNWYVGRYQRGAYPPATNSTAMNAATASATTNAGVGVLNGVLEVADLTALTALTGGIVDAVFVRDADRGGLFRWDSASSASGDSGTIFAPDAGGTGRWKRHYAGPVFAKWFGSTMQAGVTAAISGGFTHILIDSDFTQTTKFTLTTSCILEGVGKAHPVITKGANIDMIDMSASQCGMRHLDLRGVGATYTGRGAYLSNGSNGDQVLENCYIIDTAGYALEFSAADAGARFRATDCLFRRYDLSAAIGMPTTVDTAGTRYFDNCNSLGGILMAVNKGVKTMLSNCTIDDLDFSGSTSVGADLRMTITGCRMSPQDGTQTIEGGAVSMTGCVFAGNVVLGTSTGRCQIGPNAMVGGTITDNSTATGATVNEVWDAHYSPTISWKADTADPAIGNGTLACRVHRSGRKLRVDVSLTAGGTTTFGTGAWYFQLPSPFNTWVAKVEAVGIGRILDSGTTYFAAVPVIGAGSGRIYLWLDASASNVSSAAPMTWASGDTLVFSIEYEIA